MIALAGLDPRTWLRLQHTEHLDHLAVPATERDEHTAPPVAAPLLTPRVVTSCC